MAEWVWLSGAQAVAMGLLDAAHSRTWPFRRDTFPTGMAWLDVKHPAAENAAWAWGFTPDYINSIKLARRCCNRNRNRCQQLYFNY